MAKKDNPWIPSGGVLVVAVVAAVVAAILLNVYINLIEAPYQQTASFLVIDDDVAKGEAIEEGHLGVLQVPVPLLENKAFDRFVRLSDKSVVLREKARWDLHKGNLLAYRDVGADTTVPLLGSLPDNYELVKVLIEPDEMLQPGMFVNLRGRFDMDPDKKIQQIETKDVLYGVQVKAVGGSTSVSDDRRRGADSIQIAVPAVIVKKLGDIQQKMDSERFVVGKLSPDSEKVRGEPTLAPEALDLLRPAGEGAPLIP